MIKKVLGYLTLLLFPLVMNAQAGNKSFLLVPFYQKMYNNQESSDMVKRSGLNYDDVLRSFQRGLDSSIVSTLRDSMKVIDMLNGFTQSVSSDLELIHGASIYFMTDRPNLITKNKKQNGLFKESNTPTPTKKAENKNIHNGEITRTHEDLSGKFMSVKFEDISLINKMTVKYGVSYLVFITEFDITGDFSNPYTVADKSYKRTATIHFAIFRSDGSFVNGDYVTVDFAAMESIPAKICAMHFPDIAKKIGRRIP
jgi:hypothetical protein